jgi:aconitase B
MEADKDAEYAEIIEIDLNNDHRAAVGLPE